MHGIIFLYLQKFTQQQGGPQTWDELLASAGLPKKSYSAVREYPDEEAVALVGAASRRLGVEAAAALQSFGEYLGPELLGLYNTLIRPEWKTLDVIENTEGLIHAAVRMRNPGAKPPVLECIRTSETEIQIMYSSGRRLCSLAKGIVRGLARHFGETVNIADEACMQNGDPFCALQVSLVGVSAAAAESPTQLVGGQTLLGLQLDLPAMGSKLFAFLDPPRQAGELGRLGHYRMLELVGQGGMGLVFRAIDTRLERLVALKVLQPHLALRIEMHQRFLREARLLASVKSDHVITVYEVGVVNELPFMAMEFLEGETLATCRDKIAQAPLARTVRIAREAAEGLAAVHAKGLVHRDIKPSNLWIEASSGRLKILDFGLARGGMEAEALSQPGLILGTPGFMSPEQAYGQEVDHRGDLFSLGCVLYWLCTGQRPFEGRDLYGAVMALATKQAPDLRERSPSLPPDFADLVMQLLSKEREQRPASSRAVIDALAAIESNPALVGERPT